MAVVALGVGFTACNNDEIDVPNVDGQEGNTHVSVTLKMTTAGTRLAGDAEDFDENYIGKWGGDDTIESVTVYLVDGTSVNRYHYTIESGAYVVDDSNPMQVIIKPASTVAAIKTTAGQKTVYVVINETSSVKDWLNKTPVHEFEQAYQNIPLSLGNSGTSTSVSTSASKVAALVGNKDAIVMTNLAPQTITVVEGVSDTETITDATKNRASLTVQRAVARAMVTIGASTYTVPHPNPNESSPLGVLSDITWVVAQGENSLYVQQQLATPIQDWNGVTWDNYKTPNWAWVPDAITDFYAQGTTPATQNYDYSGLFENRTNKNGGTDVPTWAAYQATVGQVIDHGGVNRWLAGKFVLPTTHEYATAPQNAGSYDGGYRKGNTTYVLIRATFVPSAAAFADGGTYTKGDNFYVSAENGKFYKTAQAAYDDTNSAKMTKYENGKVLYYAWLNPDRIPSWYNSPTLRNNIYHIHITGFKNLGTNWNPLYPEDPDNPVMIPDPNNPGGPQIPSNPDPRPTPENVTDPDNPDTPITPEEPENPIDPTDPLTTPETWMSVDVTILPWKVHSYQVDLGI